MHAMAFTTSLIPSFRHLTKPKIAPSQVVCKLDQRSQIATCTGPTCTQSNSTNILLMLQELCRDVEGITVEAVGCLGECGNGPNIGISRSGDSPRIQTGVRTLHDAVDLLSSLDHTPAHGLIQALESKERGDELMCAGDIKGAVSAYDAAISMLRLRPHLLVRVLCNRSAALCEMGLGKEAMEDANEALGFEPGFASSWKRKAEAHELLKDVEMAVQSWTMWGKLTGRSEEASRKVRKLRGWRFAVFGR